MATDASVQNELTGFAVYDVGNDRNYQYRIDSEVSSTTGELLAILEAVKSAALNNIKKLAVFTDSKSACLLIKKVDPLNYIVARIIDCIISAPFLEMVQLIWTPGHSGIQINERVDSYARNAAFSGVIVDFTPDEALRHIKKNSVYKLEQ